MLDGIYHVTFSSNSRESGQGIAVFKGESINGGDHGYVYTGTKSGSSGNFSSRLTIKQWNPAVQSVFGSSSEHTLELTGAATGDDGFVAHGHVAGQPHLKITIHGRRLSPAA